MPDRDFLDELIEARTEKNPDFPGLLAKAVRARRIVKAPSWVGVCDVCGEDSDGLLGYRADLLPVVYLCPECRKVDETQTA